MGVGETPYQNSWVETKAHHPFSAPASVVIVFSSVMNLSAGDDQIINAINLSVSTSSSRVTRSTNDSCIPLSVPFLGSWKESGGVMAIWCRIPESLDLWPTSLNESLNNHRRELLYTIDLPTTLDSSFLFSFYMTNITDIMRQEKNLRPIMRATQGTLVWPGASLVALGSLSLWEDLSSPAVAALGLPKQFTKQFLYNVHSALQDPSPPTLQNNNSASIKIIFDILTKDIYAGTASVENTVLGGFSIVGGIWTFVDGVFGLIFGCTLGFILFGLKPLSVYGLVHSFTDPKPDLYTKDLRLTPDDYERIVRTLHQHLLDTGGLYAETKRLNEGGSSSEREKLVSCGNEHA
ncbi:hypothetical protein NP233_g10105 [Leucocoprinus birnbaumii]|uniref:Uncharacterized protein n=1 Tax=Leucocoprinus birnbaumii TaxID=56174 RepID=A0AAD5YQ71_9AGAR|nr:hypothetical protein NP233_g10105 [Leucocoprinus birnbaumii]